MRALAPLAPHIPTQPRAKPGPGVPGKETPRLAPPFILGLFCCALGLLPGGRDAGARFAERCAKARKGAGSVRILHFGDSHLAGGTGADYRRLFQSQWGDGGPGLGQPWLRPGPGIRAGASRGWKKRLQGQGGGPAGLAAGALATDRAGEWATLEAPFTRFRLHLLKAPDGGKAAVSVDGKALGVIELAGPAGQLALFQRELPPRAGSRKLEIRTLGGPVTILGVALEGSAGAVYSPLAFNGARAAWLKEAPEELLRAELAAEAPDLIILAFGTNEALDRDFDGEGYRKGLEAILDRLRSAAPQAALALVGPPDLDPRRGAARALAGVIAAQRAAAAAKGCLFMDPFAYMGGAGSITAWSRAGLANRDQVHLLPPGYRRLSRFVAQAILTGTGQPGLAPDRQPGPQLAQARAGGPEAAAPKPPDTLPIYVYRNKEGRMLVTNDPNAVADSQGEWIMENTH